MASNLKEYIRESVSKYLTVLRNVMDSNHTSSEFMRLKHEATKGGGVITFSSSKVLKWSSRIISIAVGKNEISGGAIYHNIYFPSVGTVINGIGTQTDVTVTAAGIHFSSWTSLWYELPPSSSSTAYGNFHIGFYSKFGSFKIPSNWILVASNINDNASGAAVKMCTNVTVSAGTSYYPDTPWSYPALTNGWVNYGSPYSLIRYKRVSNILHIEGLCKDGTFSATSTLFTLPAGFRPYKKLICSGFSNGSTIARIDVAKNGKVTMVTGNNTYVSVSISFPIDK